LPAWRRVLETILELLHQPSCKVVLGTLLLLGGGGLVLWAQRKRSRKTFPQPAQDELPESHRANDSWIKSHFSRLSQEKLHHDDYVHANACNDGLQPESGSGEASTTIHMETFTTRRGEGGTALHRESFTSRQRMSGSSMSKETHKELGVSPSMEDATWASVAACVKEIDTQGQHLANSMLQRATAYQHSGHVESEDINPEELKGLEEVEMKLKGNFFTQRDTTIAGANQAIAMATRATKATQGTRATQATKATRPIQATRATKAIQATKATRVIQATRATRVIQVTQATRIIQVTQATRATACPTAATQPMTLEVT
jgi:hypothetical protein